MTFPSSNDDFTLFEAAFPVVYVSFFFAKTAEATIVARLPVDNFDTFAASDFSSSTTEAGKAVVSNICAKAEMLLGLWGFGAIDILAVVLGTTSLSQIGPN